MSAINPYPVMLDLAGKTAVIVGGGRVAFRKAAGLMNTGADIQVISPELHPHFTELLAAGNIVWSKKKFEETDLEQAWIVIAATDSKALNRHIADLASGKTLVNTADDPASGNFHVPAKMERGKLTVAVGTGGASPILAKKIRDQIAEMYDQTFEEYLLFLERARQRITAEEKDPRIKRQLLKEITQDHYRDSDIQEDFLKGWRRKDEK